MTPEDFKQTHLVHSYIRSHTTDDGDKIIWKCANPLCSHTLPVPKKNRSILIGRMTLCPECEKTQFVLTSKDLDRKRPICSACKHPVSEETKSTIDDALKGIFGGV
jgi:ssDNA-binding Zn-finger/Zn-ribbon topoisomerase 1